MDKTRKALSEMLKENTGKHFLDSGFQSGRHWQRNQGRDFDKEQPATLTFDGGYPDVTLNLYHWLAVRLEYDPKATKAFWGFSDSEEMEYQDYFECARDWLKQIDAQPPYWSNNVAPENTCNVQNLLSQDFWYTAYKIDDKHYVILSIHNGADVRSGYTKPRCFEIDGIYGPESILDYADSHISCAGDERHTWKTENGGYKYYGVSRRYLKRLREYEIIKLSDIEEDDGGGFEEFAEILRRENAREAVAGQVYRGQKVMPGFPLPTTQHPPRGFILVNHDGSGDCPICGSTLEAY